MHFTARAFDHRGLLLWQTETDSVPSAMWRTDEQTKAENVIVRGEFTSDGMYWGPGCHGKVEAIRENGKWRRYY